MELKRFLGGYKQYEHNFDIQKIFRDLGLSKLDGFIVKKMDKKGVIRNVPWFRRW
jgi:hypothetical protein